MLGHSFGGYIAANYLLAYPSRVTSSIFLLSPMGGTTITAENNLQIEANYQKFLSAKSFADRLDVRLWKFIGRYRFTPKSFFDSWYVPKTLALKHSVRSKFGNLAKHESESWLEYLKCLFSLPESTDACIHVLINFPQAQANVSIE